MEALAQIIPVRPPIVNRNKNPIIHSIGVSSRTAPPAMVAIHLNIFIPVGIAIIMVAAEKYARVSMSMPIVNMWCAQTMKPRKPMDAMAYIMPI